MPDAAANDEDAPRKGLDALPSEVVERIVFACHTLAPRDLASLNGVARIFRGTPGANDAHVAELLRARVASRGHARVLPASLPSGVGSWTEELFAREQVLHLARAHALVAAAGASYFSAIAAFASAEGALLTCGEEYDRVRERHVSPFALGLPRGDDAAPDELAPTRVATQVVLLQDVRVRAVAAGVGHLLALSEDGHVYACGQNGCGQLGVPPELGRRQSTSGFARVHALDGELIVGVAAGSAHSVALGAGGELYSWGFNRYGQLGHGDTLKSVPIPRRVEPPASTPALRFGAASGGLYHTLLLGADGSVWACGLGANGRLGCGDVADAHAPARVGALEGVRVVHVAAGAAHSLVVDSAGAVYSFGHGRDGCLGHGDTDERLSPTRIDALAAVRAARASAGEFASAVVDADGGVHTCGANEHGELGRAPAATRTPFSAGAEPAADADEGDGRAQCATLARTPASALPARVRALETEARVVGCSLGLSRAAYFWCADGNVYACGRPSGALGVGVGMGVRATQPRPERVPALRVAVAAEGPAGPGGDSASHDFIR